VTTSLENFVYEVMVNGFENSEFCTVSRNR